ncbi:MAG TPA: 1-acyl-sn-glycerol-3-phosphate acyltransferase [Actinospica sp.]|jgi:1-acyl-sn-glycerol-3-phosphate acyltransferase|nr:1-acyl-sn-glycerol-3-phosphate acyltransferase [Actinospica sp.]
MILRVLTRYATLRRACTFTALIAICAVALLVLPPALLSGLFTRQRRAKRFAAFALAYLRAEISGLSTLARLDPKDEEAHQELLRSLLDRLVLSARRNFELTVLPPEQGLELPEGPLLVFSRHAGPGDSFLLVYALIAAGRRPRVVLTERLMLDPLIDVLLHRTPNCFVGRTPKRRAAATARIGELTGGLGPRDALLLFPEGGNFTTARRSRLISRLRSRRAWRLLPVARSLEHVLPAQPSGVFAAVDAAPPGASVVFVAHTGLDRLETVAEVWQAVPLDHPAQVAWWPVPIGSIPVREDERISWLTDWWSRIDGWIDRREEPEAQPTPGASP